MTLQISNKAISKPKVEEPPVHTHSYEIIRNSGKELGIPIWECNCGHKVISN